MRVQSGVFFLLLGRRRSLARPPNQRTHPPLKDVAVGYFSAYEEGERVAQFRKACAWVRGTLQREYITSKVPGLV